MGEGGILEPVALAGDGDDGGVMEESVAVLGEDLRRLAAGAVEDGHGGEGLGGPGRTPVSRRRLAAAVDSV